MDILVPIVLVVISTIIIAKACDGFETAADYLGRNLSDGVKGASINAIGSSMPELFTTLVFLFLFADASGFAGGIGTTAGSAVFNTMIIPAFSVLVALKVFKIAAVNVSKKVILRDGLALIAVEFILIVTIGEHLRWWHGLMLILLYAAYATYLFMSMKKSDGAQEDNDDDDDEEEADHSGNRFLAFLKLDLETAVVGNKALATGNAWALLTAATVVIAAACYILAYGCESFGHAIGIHGYFVAVILAAAASSVPDTILSMKDAKKGNYDDAVSNALGSNIFDVCVALGLPLLLYTLIYGDITMPTDMVEHVSELRILLLFLTIAAFLVFFLGKGIGKGKAMVLLGMYALFTAYIVARAYEAPWLQPVVNTLHSIQSLLQ